MIRERRKSPFRFLIWLVVLALIGYFSYQGMVSFLKSPIDKNGKVEAFIIKPGETVSDIATRLEDKKIIRSAFFFKMAYKSSGEGDIQAGDYKLSPSMSTDEVVKNLKEGAIDRWVTLLEGWRAEEMADKLNKELGIDQTEFLKEAKEGYMFPDTYLFNIDATAADIVAVMENNFNTKYTTELQNKIKAQGLTPEQGVILASIVEREGRSDEVRRQIASILLKRFKIEMVLNADATIQYALGYQESEKTWWKRHLSLSDLKIESPYNSYTHKGFPPTPIANPSLSSLNAVANADSSTPYVYYYHDLKGNSYYARTLDEHNANVANNP